MNEMHKREQRSGAIGSLHCASFGCDKLYEANFLEWEPCMIKVLEDAGLHEPENVWQAAMAADLIIPHVQPGFLQRVPLPQRYNSSELLEDLKAFGGVFRFCDLPPELRNRVYDSLFSDTREDYVSWKKKRPAITRVSSLLCHEALPLYVRASRFAIDGVWPGDEYVARIRFWANNILTPPMLPYLRQVTIRVLGPHARDWVPKLHFTKSPEEGLAVRQPLTGLGRYAQSWCSNVEAETKAFGGLLGIEDGRLIIMALLLRASALAGFR